MWGIRPPRGLWYHSVAQRPSPIPPCGRSGISLKCCAFLAAYAASYTQSVSPWLCLPPFESSLKKRCAFLSLVYSHRSRAKLLRRLALRWGVMRGRVMLTLPGALPPLPCGKLPGIAGGARACSRQALNACPHSPNYLYLGTFYFNIAFVFVLQRDNLCF